MHDFDDCIEKMLTFAFGLYKVKKMKTDLKTNIKLYQVSSRYYRPENEIELASLTRYEKVPTTVMGNADEGAPRPPARPPR